MVVVRRVEFVSFEHHILNFLQNPLVCSYQEGELKAFYALYLHFLRGCIIKFRVRVGVA